VGKAKFHRQRQITEAAGVEAKSFFEFLTNHVKTRREIAHDEAVLLAHDAMEYLFGRIVKGMGQIDIPAIRGLDNHQRSSRINQDEVMIRVTPIAYDDTGLLSEFGINALQTARIARMIEEAAWQDALCDVKRLLLLVPMTAKTVRESLKPLWEQGARLPIAGMTRDNRAKLTGYRATLAIKAYLGGEDSASIRRRLFISSPMWARWWGGFKAMISAGGQTACEIAISLGLPEQLIQEWLDNLQELRGCPKFEERLVSASPLAFASSRRNSDEDFRQLLRRRHNFSPAAAEQLDEELRELAVRFDQTERGNGQVIFIAVASDERPGKSLVNSRLLAVVLDYLLPSDWEALNPDSPGELLWSRMVRLVEQAYIQGAALAKPDIGYLLGISVDSVRTLEKKHPDVLLPTRGHVADMGSNPSHAEKIINDFMWGYTETEINRRTGHSYESIERYLLDFSKVTCLLDSGMPLPMVRQVLGKSQKVVERYNALYIKYNVKDFVWTMAKLRRLTNGHKPTDTKGKPT
jgi:hypothetical protein